MKEEIETYQEDTIDVKALIIKFSQYWYYFIVSVVLCLFFAFLSNRYTAPEYSVSTTLLIRDDNNTQMGAENILEGLEIFSGKRNIKNEIVILNSYSITEKIIKELQLGTSYFQHGFIISNELFTDFQNYNSLVSVIRIDDYMGTWSNYENNVSDHRPVGLKLDFGAVSYISEEICAENRVFKLMDILGRDVQKKKSGLVFKVFDDGTVEKKIILE